MLKSTLGLAVLLGAVGPAAAENKSGRGLTVKFIHPDAYVSPYPDQSVADVTGTLPTEPQANIGPHASEP